MRGINRVFIIGRVGQDPELRVGKTGTPWMRLSVATNRGVKHGDEWQEETDWHRVHLFGTNAERAMDMARAGTLVHVEGSITYEKWTDEEGVRRMSCKVLGDRVSFIKDMKEREAVAEA